MSELLNSYEKMADEYRDKLKQYGPLSLTAEDHISIGSTPNEDMKNNPEKTRGELIKDDEEIKKWFHKNCPTKYKESTIRYLESVGRCEDLIKEWRKKYPKEGDL